MESSKATAKYIKQVATNSQAAQIHWMCQQCTELPSSKFQRKQKKHFKSRQDTNKQHYYNEEKQRGPPVHKKYETHVGPGRHEKCDDSQHVEGFRCPASKYQCKNCHMFGHFSSLCYKKKEFEHKRESSSRAHQLKIGTAYMQNELCRQSDESSSDDSFCLQVKLKSTQAETPAPQHLITNLAYKLKPHKKTHYLRARLDTYSDVKIMPVSVYHLIFKDVDCRKHASSSKLKIGTYTSVKIKVIGSCTLLVLHPDTKCLKEVTFHVTSHEGSIVLSCATTLDLCLIQPHNNLDSIPYSASLITSKADDLRKKKSQKNMLVSKPKKNVCSGKEQSPKLLPA